MTAGGVSTVFAYDALGRMTSRVRSGVTTAYAYNATGDLTSVRSGTVTAPMWLRVGTSSSGR